MCSSMYLNIKRCYFLKFVLENGKEKEHKLETVISGLKFCVDETVIKSSTLLILRAFTSQQIIGRFLL